MLNRKRKIEINGKEFEIYLLRVTKALAMAQKLSKVILPVVGEVFAEGVERVQDVDFSSVANLVVEKMDDLDLVAITQELLKELTVDGIEVDLDTYFMAQYDELLSVLAFAFKENFSSFFRAKGLLIG